MPNFIFLNTLNFFNFFTIPFVFEFILIFISVAYIFFCASVARTTNNLSLVFDFAFFFKKILIFLIIGGFFSLFYPNLFNNSTFFNGYLLNTFSSFFLKFFFLSLCYMVFSQFFNFVYKFFDYWNDFKLYPLFLIGSFFFLILIFSAYNLILAVLCILGMSICFYVVLLGHMGFGKITRETIVKYFLFSALSTGFLLGGLKEIYVCCGTLQFNKVNNIFLNLVIENLSTFQNLIVLKVAIVLILFGFFFKLSAFPSHFWAPEVYDGTPYALLSFIVIPTKFSISYLLLKIIKIVFVLPVAAQKLNFYLFNEIDMLLSFVVICSILVGGILALKEKRIKRFIAYSSVNQIGFLLVGLLGYNSDLFGLQVFLYFLFIYIFNLVLFLVLLMWYAYKLNIFLNTCNSKLLDFKFDLNYVSDLKYMYFYFQLFSTMYPKFYFVSISFWASFVLVLFSFAGIPPLLGFYGKFYILIYAFQYKYWSVLCIGIFMSILGAFYYLRFLKVVFFEKFEITSYEQNFIDFIRSAFNPLNQEQETETRGVFYFILLLENMFVFNKFKFFYIFLGFLNCLNLLLLFGFMFDNFFMQFLYIISQYIYLF